jgi:deoxyribodipyrimidine photo-lyase
VDGTSKLSAHLHFGEISPAQIIHNARSAADSGKLPYSCLEKFFAEIGWREFGYYLLYHFPESSLKSLDKRFDQQGWIKTSNHEKLLKAWQQGKTGIPIVDAGMRELWQTGYMHNRVRMICASILTKNMGFHWLEGARWFWDTLVDADLASNTLGWQWTAGCGVDAAPYFRIFSPPRQTERFDPEGEYIKHWIPELAEAERRFLIYGLPNNDTGFDYPEPVIDLAESRKAALARWDNIRHYEAEIAV